MTDRLNPEAFLAAKDAAQEAFHDHKDWHDITTAILSAYDKSLASAQPCTIEGVYDLGSPEPEGVDHVIECDENGNPYERDPEGSDDPTWSKTIDGTRWKGYKDGKEYRDWGDLVRRYGPVIDVRWVPTEGGGDAT
ncbi:hypothetical protein [Glutamicibacter sp. V16R2B1]|uniref:hypothetical protein n=1 Tax=Glutamicibacter sp. V16R2B1 TaxID=2036207 RepID=UPI0010FE1143|nr:hypothetical protein [Glutamicibacter sp. V16R2B1]TLK56298.1 hypothetical protein FDN03_02275 [Glutamicibacter sp. V16R2B1]